MSVRHVCYSPRMREFLEAVRIVANGFEGEFVIDLTVYFMPVDGGDGELIEAPMAKARFGKFVKTRTS